MRFENDLQKYIYYHGQIDLGYYLLGEMAKVMALPKHPLIAAIDAATGVGDAEFIRFRKQAIKLIVCIIRQKKIYNYDVSYDQEFLKQVKALNP